MESRTCHSECFADNQLLRIEEELGDIAEYPGMKAFFNLK